MFSSREVTKADFMVSSYGIKSNTYIGHLQNKIYLEAIFF